MSLYKMKNEYSTFLLWSGEIGEGRRHPENKNERCVGTPRNKYGPSRAGGEIAPGVK